MCINSSDDVLLDALKAWPGDDSRAYNLLTVGLFVAVVFTTKSLLKFVCKMDKCCS